MSGPATCDRPAIMSLSATSRRQGIVAKSADLQRAFGTDSHVEVCKIILDKGEMQASFVRFLHERRG